MNYFFQLKPGAYSRNTCPITQIILKENRFVVCSQQKLFPEQVVLKMIAKIVLFLELRVEMCASFVLNIRIKQIMILHSLKIMDICDMWKREDGTNATWEILIFRRVIRVSHVSFRLKIMV